MAIEYITQAVTSSNTHGGRLKNAAAQLASVRDEISKLRKIMEAMVDDPTTPTVFTTLETAFGLEAGAGTKALTLVKDADAAITVSAVSKLTSRVA